ncbi:MAG: DUF4062 domain-containing protein [Elainellaceae cyanobacterium]
MPQQGTILRVLIASPGDVQQERQAIPEVIAAWNAANSLERAVIIEPVKWESHAVPGLYGRPQGMINDQLVNICDFLVGVFWTRLGTDTGVAPSGTAEEIEEFRKAGKPVLLYFSSRPVDPDSINFEQYEKLKTYRKDLESQGLLDTYHDVGELRNKLARHINSVVIKLVSGNMTPDNTQILMEEGSTKKVFINQLEIFVRRLSAGWQSERAIQPVNLENAKYIIQLASDDLINFISHIPPELSEEIGKPLTNCVGHMKDLRQHQVYLDGGVSYQKFWQKGDEIIERLEQFVVNLKV